MEKHMIAKSAVRWVKSANVISPFLTVSRSPSLGTFNKTTSIS